MENHSIDPSGKLPPALRAGAAIRIVLADDHDLVRSAIKALLCRIPGVEVTAEARTGHELIDSVQRLAPDIAITDLTMPGMGGLDAIRHLARACPGTRLLVLSMHDNASQVRLAMENGACGYLMKSAAAFELEHAVRTVTHSGRYFSSQVARLLLEPAAPTASDELTARQIQVLGLIANGRASKQIAQALGLAAKTVDVHRGRIMDRLQLHSIAELTRYAIRMGLVEQ